jgi:lipoprotein-releasing system permease protein
VGVILRLTNFISLRYLFSKKSEKFISFVSTISIVGITLGVATLIIVINVMIGFEDNLKNKIMGVNAHIIVNRIDRAPIENWRAVEDSLGKIDGVVAVSPFLINQVMISRESSVSGAVIRGVESSKEAEVNSIKKFIIDGRLPAEKDNAFEIVIGKELSLQLGAIVGDNITVISPMGTRGPFGFVPLMKHFKVVGIFDCGIYDYNATFTFIDLSVAQNFFKTGDIITAFSVKTENFDRAKKIAKNIEETLYIPYVARDWISMNKNLFSALKLEKVAMFLILTLIIIVASFNIISLITITVKDKTKDIAIFRAVGGSEKLVRGIFIRQGLLIGAAGVVIGNILAIIACYILENYKLITLPEDIYYMDRIPIKIVPEIFLIVSISAMIITYISTLYPSKRASRINPAEALKNE